MAAAVLLIVAVGSGPNALVVGLVRSTLLKRLPYPKADRLAIVSNVSTGSRRVLASLSQMEEWAKHAELFSDVAAIKRLIPLVLSGEVGTRRVQAVMVTPTFFALLGVHAAVGRSFLPADSGTDSVVISYDTWQSEYHGASDVVGRQVRLSDHAYTIIGVTPPGFDFPRHLYPPRTAFDVWLPLGRSPQQSADTSLAVTVIARLADGVKPDIASRRLSLLVPQPLRDIVARVQVVDMQDAIVGDVRPALLLLAGASGFVLLLMCANLTNLFLVTLEAGLRNTAIRLALGATRWRILREFSWDWFLLAMGGALGGMLLANWLTPVVSAALPLDYPKIAALRMDWFVATVTAASAIATVVLAGVLAFLSAGIGSARAMLAGPNAAFILPKRSRLRDALVIAEVALAIMLTTGSVLTAKAYWKQVSIPTGYDPARIFTVAITMPAGGSNDESRIGRLVDSIVAGFKDSSAVEAAAAVTGVAGIHAGAAGSFVPVLPSGMHQVVPTDASLDEVSGGYFQVMGIPLLWGRTFRAEDVLPEGRVAIVDRAAARLLMPGSAQKQIVLDDAEHPLDVVGVVDHVRLLGEPHDDTPHIYLPFGQLPLPVFMLVLRSSHPVTAVVSATRRTVADADPRAAVGVIAPMAERIEAQARGPRFHLFTVGTLGLLALALASFGVFSVMEYAVSLRMKEMAIRSSLGAPSGALVALMVRSGMKLLAVGVFFGLIGTILLRQALSASLPEVKSTDFSSAFTSVAVVGLAAFAATMFPARRVLATDAQVMLRLE
jgi:putative ABC transport system permease protein